MSELTRRRMLAGAVASLAGPVLAQGTLARPDARGRLRFPPTTDPIVDFEKMIDRPVTIRSVELWITRDLKTPMVRVISQDGVEGVVRASTKAMETVDFFKRFAVPRFVGKDARKTAGLIASAARNDYEFAGLPYWSAVGQVETAIWDLLGKTANRRCAAMIGPVLRDRVPIYMSSNKRDTSPAVEIAHLQQAVAASGARAIKLKIGKRMGYNDDFAPGRTEAVIRLARRTFGDGMTIYADANGAYDAAKAVEVAAMLEDNGVAMLEEPCPFEDFEMTAQATRAIRARRGKIKVAGGEQDYALERWRWFAANKVFDIVQPDPMYAGGIFRNLVIAKMAREAGLGYNPHFPRNGADSAPLVHLCAVAPNLYGYQEYRSRADVLDFAHAPTMVPQGGSLPLPPGPGWGIAYDPAIWRTATRIGV